MDFDESLRGVRAVIVLRAASYAAPRATVETLVAADLPIVEFTVTGAGALDAVEQARHVDGALVGAGSVTDSATATRCVDAGAEFVVSPVTATDVAETGVDVPVVLAGFTPTEVWTAWTATHRPVKVFPASVGGPDHLRAIAGPLPQIPLMPSGGVDTGNAADYLAAGAVAVNVGSAVAPSGELEAGDTDEIARRAARLRAVVDRQ